MLHWEKHSTRAQKRQALLLATVPRTAAPENHVSRVCVDAQVLILDSDAVVDVAHLISHCRLVRSKPPLVVNDKLVLVRACLVRSCT